MKLLLDAHALLWYDTSDPKLSKTARAALDREDAEPIISAATIWELAIKSSLGRLKLRMPMPQYLTELQDLGYLLLAVTGTHAAAVADLPHHHRDPFDRLLIIQALAEDLPVVTRDRLFKKYGVKVIW